MQYVNKCEKKALPVTAKQNTQTCFQYCADNVPLIFCFIVANDRLAIWGAMKYANNIYIQVTVKHNFY